MKKIGKISQIMGAVVDVSFEDGQMPNILNALFIFKNNARRAHVFKYLYHLL